MAAPLPNRVGRACDRCRRNKSRCDPFRPCALCTRSGSKCITDNIDYSKSSAGVPFSDHLENPSSDRKRRRQVSRVSPTASEVHVPVAQSNHFHQEAPSVSPPTPPAAITESNVDDDRGDSAINIARNIYRLGSRQLNEQTLSAIPGADSPDETSREKQNQHQRMPITSYLAHALPSEDEIAILMTEYFETVHWFSLVIIEPKFRPMRERIKDGFAKRSEEPFLVLFSTVLGLAACYLSHKSTDRADHWKAWSTRLLFNAECQITKLLESSSLLAIQTLTLLGSFYVYHGRPTLSFSLLGATIKAAQAAGLHHNVSQVSHIDAEERKRVWWTIYTWDRFASITYGRPLGINDKDCNVAMPIDVEEDIIFTSDSSRPHNSLRVTYSAYQRSLNQLYVIASPAIEILYSARESENSGAADRYVALLHKVSAELWRWRRALSPELSLDLENDCSTGLEPGKRAHLLQSLSLHLTFESLLIILHRPYLKQQVQLMKSAGPVRNQKSPSGTEHTFLSNIDRSSASPSQAQNLLTETLGPYQWWDAAVRTARVTELEELTEMATETHLISFLALNLFNAAIVMVVLALSDPLDDRAQEAKRSVSRIYRLQSSLGSRSRLSKQSSQVIHALVKLLLRRERELILDPAPQKATVHQEHDQAVDNTAQHSTYQSNPPNLSQENSNRTDWRTSMWPQPSELDLASRLDLSLASVQKVFAAGQQFSAEELGQPTSNAQDQAPGQDSYFMPVDYSGAHVSSTEFDPMAMQSDWNEMNLNISDGVGWFWDPSWGGDTF